MIKTLEGLGFTKVRTHCKHSIAHTKVQQFYGLRIFLGGISAYCETMLVRYVQLYKSRYLGHYLLLLLSTSAGMFVAATGKHQPPSLPQAYSVCSISSIDICNVRRDLSTLFLASTPIKDKDNPSILYDRYHSCTELAIRGRAGQCVSPSRYLAGPKDRKQNFRAWTRPGQSRSYGPACIGTRCSLRISTLGFHNCGGLGGL